MSITNLTATAQATIEFEEGTLDEEGDIEDPASLHMEIPVAYNTSGATHTTTLFIELTELMCHQWRDLLAETHSPDAEMDDSTMYLNDRHIPVSVRQVQFIQDDKDLVATLHIQLLWSMSGDEPDQPLVLSCHCTSPEL